MADEQLKKKVHDILKMGYFNGTDGKYLKEKNDLIWFELMQHLSQNEWGKISLSIGVSLPNSIKTTEKQVFKQRGI